MSGITTTFVGLRFGTMIEGAFIKKKAVKVDKKRWIMG